MAEEQDKQDKESKGTQDKGSAGAPAPNLWDKYANRKPGDSRAGTGWDKIKKYGILVSLFVAGGIVVLYNSLTSDKIQEESKKLQTEVAYYDVVSQYTTDISEKFPELTVADTEIKQEIEYAAPSQKIAEKRYDKKMVELFSDYLNSNQFVKIEGKNLDDLTDICNDGFIKYITFLRAVNKGEEKSKYSDEVLNWAEWNIYGSPCNEYIGTMLNKEGLTIDGESNILKDGKIVNVIISLKK